MDAGTVGAVIGAVIGLAGGAVGTYASIKNTRGPRERRFMVRTAIVVWTGILLFLAILFVTPSPYRWLVWIAYGVALPFAIFSLNRKQQAIRSDEERSQRV